MLKTTYIEQGNVFIRLMEFEHAGDCENDVGHVHSYDHTHFVIAGELEVEVNGERTRYGRFSPIYIGAGEVHKITALVDGSASMCIHALRSKDKSGEPVDPACVPRGSSALAVADLVVRAV